MIKTVTVAEPCYYIPADGVLMLPSVSSCLAEPQKIINTLRCFSTLNITYKHLLIHACGNVDK